MHLLLLMIMNGRKYREVMFLQVPTGWLTNFFALFLVQLTNYMDHDQSDLAE